MPLAVSPGRLALASTDTVSSVRGRARHAHARAHIVHTHAHEPLPPHERDCELQISPRHPRCRSDSLFMPPSLIPSPPPPLSFDSPFPPLSDSASEKPSLPASLPPSLSPYALPHNTTVLVSITSRAAYGPVGLFPGPNTEPPPLLTKVSTLLLFAS